MSETAFDLDAYLARILLPARPTVDSYGLAALQRAHRLAIPFENLDVLLGRGIAIDSDSVFAKLVVISFEISLSSSPESSIASFIAI